MACALTLYMCRSARPIAPNGGYIAAQPVLPKDGGRVRVEACLPHASGDRRLRVVATFMQDWQTKAWGPVFVDLVNER
jgi:hypothetical protein